MANHFVTLNGAGSQTAADWDNAQDLSSLSTVISGASAGDNIFLGVPNGSDELWPIATSIQIGNGGTSGNPLKIIGVQIGTDGSAGGNKYGGRGPILWGQRDRPWSSSGSDGTAGCFWLNNGADYIEFRNLRFEGFSETGCIRMREDPTYIEIYNCHAFNCGRFIECVSGGSGPGTVDNLTVKWCTSTGHSRSFARIGTGTTSGDQSSNVTFEDCLADGDFVDGDDFQVGFDLKNVDTCTLTRCISRNHVGYLDNSGDEQTSGEYINADGFSSEEASSNITFNQCHAYNNSDGGWDCKGDTIVLNDCYAHENKRNYRFWYRAGSTDPVLNRCRSYYPISGNYDGSCFWTNGPATIDGGHFIADDRVSKVIHGEEQYGNNADITLTNVRIDYDTSATLASMEQAADDYTITNCLVNGVVTNTSG